MSSRTAWLVLECLKALGVNAFCNSVNQQMAKLDTILLAGVFCSLANSFLMTTVLEAGDHIQSTTLVMAAYAIGDDLPLNLHPAAFRVSACSALPPFFGSLEAGVFGLFHQ